MPRRDSVAGALTAAVLAAGVCAAILGTAALRPRPDGALSLAGPWKHRFGDDPSWARPETDDSRTRASAKRFFSAGPA